MGDELRNVGPEPTAAAEASGLVGELGVHNRGEELVRAVQRARPREVTKAQARPEDLFRTRLLDEDEVIEKFEAAFGKKAGTVIKGRVRGKGAKVAEMDVVVLYYLSETDSKGNPTGEPSTQTARAVLPYADFTETEAAYQEAVAAGKFNPWVSPERPEELAKQLDAADAAVAGAQNQTAAELREQIPNLSDGELDALEQVERDGKGRTTVLSAIEAERDSR